MEKFLFLPYFEGTSKNRGDSDFHGVLLKIIKLLLIQQYYIT
jgi:hypothetical protein